jgi:hypothetical protein
VIQNHPAVKRDDLEAAASSEGDEWAKASRWPPQSPVGTVDLCDNNRVGSSGAERLCECAIQHDVLEILNVALNQIKDEGLKSVMGTGTTSTEI